MWQQCPNCKGTGVDNNTLEFNKINVCSICEGKKIISELTGLPPMSKILQNKEKRILRINTMIGEIYEELSNYGIELYLLQILESHKS